MSSTPTASRCQALRDQTRTGDSDAWARAERAALCGVLSRPPVRHSDGAGDSEPGADSRGQRGAADRVAADRADAGRWRAATQLRARRGQYVIVDQDSVRLALSRTRDVTELTKSLNADLLVSIRFAVIPHDSAVLMLQAYDLTAVNAYRARTATNKTVAKNEVLTNLDVLLLSTLTYLDEMSRAPRRP